MADWIEGDDPFEGIFQEFFGRGRPRSRGRGRFTRGEEEERTIDLVEDAEHVYLIFELPVYGEDDVSIDVNGRTLEIRIEKKNVDGIKEYLAQKLSTGMSYTRTLPDSALAQNFTYTLNNGILEIVFRKKS